MSVSGGSARPARTAAPGSISLDSPVSSWHKLNPALEKKLAKLRLFTLRDVLFHLPLRYVDKTRITPVAKTLPGQEALVEGSIIASGIRYYGRRRVFTAMLQDDTGQLQLRFFHVYQWHQQRFREGTRMRCYGQVRAAYGGSLEMVHPEVSVDMAAALEQKLTPVYPSTEKLQQRVLQQLTRKAISLMARQGNMRTLPEYIKLGNTGQLPGIEESLQFIHQPPPGTNLEKLQSGELPQVRRLLFEELLAFRLALLQHRGRIRTARAAAMKADRQKQQLFIDSLPFKLTAAQLKAITEINTDLAAPVPMQRLLQGDVGTGKTVVAAMAALNAADNGYSTCIMAPTELLAQQHYNTISKLFAAADKLEPVLFTGKLTAAQRREARQSIEQDQPCIVIGTHALIQNDLNVSKLGLVVIDEQHRFGVDQRLELLQRGDNVALNPHQLIMTATPIPRTLAMTLYADLDVSTLDALPSGRKAIVTTVMSSQNRDQVTERVQAQCQDKNQAYWVCSLIDESEQLQKQAAISTYEYLQNKLPRLNIGLIHGRLKAAEKDKIMQSFIAGDISLLVATTVIEVGIDVPAANLIIIENAERLGLAQLHQLRGRVGRGKEQSYCLLLYDPPLGQLARQRLEIMKQSNDGFFIAENDLRLRGPGEMFGSRQTGIPEMRIANLARDAAIMPLVVAAADKLLRTDNDIAEEIVNRWQAQRLHYPDA